MPDAAPIKITSGDVIKSGRYMFTVRKKLGEGSCGQVWKMDGVRDGKSIGKVAMKVEAMMKCKDDEILKMEVFVMRKMQKSHHVCRFYAAGKQPTYTYLVMSLLGRELADIRRRLPNRKMNLSSILRVSLQTLRALQDMHDTGFLHRDVKPSNLAMGAPINKQVVFIFDFGLSRRFADVGKDKELKLVEPRNKVMFRGTVRYCSINVHNYKEQGRHDDLISAMYSMIELHTAVLPWKGHKRIEAARLKETTTEKDICKDCPPMYVKILEALSKLTYADRPPYEKFAAFFRDDLRKRGIKMTDTYEWEEILKNDKKKAGRTTNGDGRGSAGKMGTRDKDDKDNDTLREVEDSVITEGIDEDDNPQGFDAENTLEGLE